MDRIKEFASEHKKAIILCTGIVLLAVLTVIFMHRKQVEQVEQPDTVTTEQAESPNYWGNHFKVPENQTQEIVRYVEKAETGSTRPAASIMIQAPDTSAAAGRVAERIKEKDETLPAAAIEKADRTTIVEQPTNKDYQVGVYKINLRKDHKLKAGMMNVDGSAYWAAGYQNRKMEYTLYGQGKDVKGGSVLYTVAEW